MAKLALGVIWLLAAVMPAAAGGERTSAPAGGPAEPVTRVLLIQVTPTTAPALIAHEQAFTSTLTRLLPRPVAFHTEYLELMLFDQRDSFEHQLVEYLAAKYAHAKPDLIAVTASTGLRFALRHRGRLFGDIPIVFSAVDEMAAADIELDSNVSGVWLSPDWRGTLEAARRLQPDLEQVFVVTGDAPGDRVWTASARAQLAGLERAVKIAYLDGLTIEALERRLAALPPNSAVVLGAFRRDGAGRTFVLPEVVPRLRTVTRAPIYTLVDNALGLGAVGGHVISFEAQGREAAELAAQMLHGERPPAG